MHSVMDKICMEEIKTGVLAELAFEPAVTVTDSQHRTDGDIAAAVAHQIDWFTTIPPHTVEVTVHEGWITLEGQMEWSYQKDAAGNVLQRLPGVRGVTNLIMIKPRRTPAEVAISIQSAIERSGILEGEKIHAGISGHRVVLQGRVQNHPEREEAERLARAAPGVLSVDNQLAVARTWAFMD